MALSDGQVHFLFHKTFSGRRTGLLVDFGGGSRLGESQEQTAAREFVEETEAMFLADDPELADLDLHKESQIQTLLERLQASQNSHPDWCCRRRNSTAKKPKDWKTYFLQVDYQPLQQMNELWRQNPRKLFKKRRELVWLTRDQLLNLFENEQQKLWTRVRELEDAPAVIRSISHFLLS